MENVARKYRAAFVVNLSELGDSDPLMHNVGSSPEVAMKLCLKNFCILALLCLLEITNRNKV